MLRNMLRAFAWVGVLCLATSMAYGDVITQWTFEGDVITPETGEGTASLVGGTTATFATGNGGGKGWNTSTYPAQSTGSGTAGVQFLVSTDGWQDIKISFDHRASSTASRWAQLDYTLDGGTNWATAFWNNNGGLSPDATFYSFTEIDFSSVMEANGNPDFGFRIVSIFSPLAFEENASVSYGADVAYMRANAQAGYEEESGIGTGTYGTSGTWRFDNVTVSGTVIPEPGAMTLVGLGFLSFVGMGISRRRRKLS